MNDQRRELPMPLRRRVTLATTRPWFRVVAVVLDGGGSVTDDYEHIIAREVAAGPGGGLRTAARERPAGHVAADPSAQWLSHRFDRTAGRRAVEGPGVHELDGQGMHVGVFDTRAGGWVRRSTCVISKHSNATCAGSSPR